MNWCPLIVVWTKEVFLLTDPQVGQILSFSFVIHKRCLTFSALNALHRESRKWGACRCNYMLWRADTGDVKLWSICPFHRICLFFWVHSAGTRSRTWLWKTFIFNRVNKWKCSEPCQNVQVREVSEYVSVEGTNAESFSERRAAEMGRSSAHAACQTPQTLSSGCRQKSFQKVNTECLFAKLETSKSCKHDTRKLVVGECSLVAFLFSLLPAA